MSDSSADGGYLLYPPSNPSSSSSVFHCGPYLLNVDDYIDSILTAPLGTQCCSHSSSEEVERGQVREEQRGHGNQAHGTLKLLTLALLYGIDSERGVGRVIRDTDEGRRTHWLQHY